MTFRTNRIVSFGQPPPIETVPESTLDLRSEPIRGWSEEAQRRRAASARTKFGAPVRIRSLGPPIKRPSFINPFDVTQVVQPSPVREATRLQQVPGLERAIKGRPAKLLWQYTRQFLDPRLTLSDAAALLVVTAFLETGIKNVAGAPDPSTGNRPQGPLQMFPAALRDADQWMLKRGKGSIVSLAQDQGIDPIYPRSAAYMMVNLSNLFQDWRWSASDKRWYYQGKDFPNLRRLQDLLSTPYMRSGRTPGLILLYALISINGNSGYKKNEWSAPDRLRSTPQLTAIVTPHINEIINLLSS